MRRPPLPFVLLPAAFLVLFAAAAGLGGLTGGEPIGGHWALTTGDGARVTDRDFRGRYLLLFFGYTSCPDICPTTLQTVAGAMQSLMQSLGPRAERLQPLFITVDPSHDTPRVVRDYVRLFSPHLVGLTGSPAAIAKVEREWHVSSRIDREPDGSYAISHTAVLLLVGPDGRFLAPFPADETARALAARLARYLT